MTDETLTPSELEKFMQTQGIFGEILHQTSKTQTVEAAAQAVGTIPERIVKSILFMIEEKPVLAITCGPAHVDRKAIANLYGVGKKKVKLAQPEIVLRETGFLVGAMPPFGHKYKLTTLLDRRVLEQPEIFAGGGAENVLVKLTPHDILKFTNAHVMDLITPNVTDT